MYRRRGAYWAIALALVLAMRPAGAVPLVTQPKFGGDVIYDRAHTALPVQPSRAVIGKQVCEGTSAGTAHVEFADGSHADVTCHEGSTDGSIAMTFADGTRFEYTVQGNSYVGPAVMRFPDGSRLEYHYEQRNYDGAGTGGDGYGDAVFHPRHGAAIRGSFIPAQPDLTIGIPWTMPEMPALSRRLNETGTVTLSFVVAADGLLRDIKVHESSGSLRLDKAALDAAAAWHYRVARLVVRSDADTYTFLPIPVTAMISLAFRMEPSPIVTGP